MTDHERATPRQFPPFKRVVWMVYCADCREEMPGEKWPNHWRTKRHRSALSEPSS